MALSNLCEVLSLIGLDLVVAVRVCCEQTEVLLVVGMFIVLFVFVCKVHILYDSLLEHILTKNMQKLPYF